MPKAPFAVSWSNKFCSGNLITKSKADRWILSLGSHAHRPWNRIICRQWHDTPIDNHNHVMQILQQLRDDGHKWFFITPRGNSGVHNGVHIYCGESTLPFVVWLHAAPVVSTRSYTSDEFNSHMQTIVSWCTRSW